MVTFCGILFVPKGSTCLNVQTDVFLSVQNQTCWTFNIIHHLQISYLEIRYHGETSWIIITTYSTSDDNEARCGEKRFMNGHKEPMNVHTYERSYFKQWMVNVGLDGISIQRQREAGSIRDTLSIWMVVQCDICSVEDIQSHYWTLK